MTRGERISNVFPLPGACPTPPYGQAGGGEEGALNFINVTSSFPSFLSSRAGKRGRYLSAESSYAQTSGHRPNFRVP